MNFIDYFYTKKRKQILKKCLKDHILMNQSNIKKLAIKRIINFIITQYKQFTFLYKMYPNEEINFILALLIQNRIVLFSTEIRKDISLQKKGSQKIIEGAHFIAENKYKEWENLSLLEKFKLLIFCIQIAEFLWDSSKVFPPDLFYFEISEEAQLIFFHVFDHVFEVEKWIIEQPKKEPEVTANQNTDNIESKNNTSMEESKFFTIDFACKLVGKTIDNVMKSCKNFDPQLIDTIEVSKELNNLGYNKTIYIFSEIFKIADYHTISSISFNCFKDIAVECIISFGKPVKNEGNKIEFGDYSWEYDSKFESEKAVLDNILFKLEKKYKNGKIISDIQESQVISWLTNNRILISYFSGQSENKGRCNIGIQIRDINSHPLGITFYSEYTNSNEIVKSLF